MNLTLKVWRQSSPNATGRIETYEAKDIPSEASFLEMLDIVNEGIVAEGGEPIHFDHDCREGICGACSLAINGVPHSLESGITTCQVHMRKFREGDTIWIEPFRARAFPVLMVALFYLSLALGTALSGTLAGFYSADNEDTRSELTALEITGDETVVAVAAGGGRAGRRASWGLRGWKGRESGHNSSRYLAQERISRYLARPCLPIPPPKPSPWSPP